MVLQCGEFYPLSEKDARWHKKMETVGGFAMSDGDGEGAAHGSIEI
jgi:hypothetical protein